MFQTKRNSDYIRLGGLILTSAILSAGCAEDRPYDQVYKPESGKNQIVEKNLIDTNADYLYVVSTVNTPRKSTATRPHWMAQAKRVRFRFTEDALKVIQPEEDGRFQDNPNNASAVLKIPIHHVDYRCQEDSYGKCTQKEEENREIAWNQKTKFTLDPDGMAAQQVELLPIAISNLFSSCYREVGSEIVESKVESDAINILVDKTFQKSGPCAYTIFSLEEASFTVRYHYSMVKLSKLASKEYQPVRYTRADETNFGFFPTVRHRLDVDNNDTEESLSFLFDRWNPNRTVPFYMNETFNKPEFAGIKKATYKAFEVVNLALQKANTNLRLELKEPVGGMHPGDLRNNMIVAVDDPQASGVIGYGPHASNPKTGEIVHARTVMYVGTLTKYIKYTYDDIINANLRKSNAATSDSVGLPTTGDQSLSLSVELEQKVSERQRDLASTKTEAVPMTHESNGLIDSLTSFLNEEERRAEMALASQAIDKQFVKATQLREIVNELSESEHFPAGMLNFHETLKDGIKELVAELGEKPWIALSAEERQKVVDKLLPYVYLPTLIHELGHNLGLRHNFAGSEDKDNFYSSQEIADIQSGQETSESNCRAHGHKLSEFRSSSIMDYSYSSAGELPLMGKYDIAALRYGYAQEVELDSGDSCKKGQVISVAELQTLPQAQIKSYGYCTDEHVSANPNCNRFDAGTNILEIAENLIGSYKIRYQRSNFRNGRRNFSLYSDTSQIGSLLRTFMGLRRIFERYESIKNTYDLDATDPIWEEIPFLSELKQATILSGQFFLEILKTPDNLCAISAVDSPFQILAVLPIRDLSKSAISCFDSQNVRLNPAYMIVAEGGRSFQSRKSPHSSNSYADQIDVRGIWMDKLLASRFLLKREMGESIFDRYTENYLSVPELQAEILSAYQQVLFNNYVAPVEFTTFFGAQVPITVPYGAYDVNDSKNSHKLIDPVSRVARRYMRLPGHTTSFQKVVFQSMAQDIFSETTHRAQSEGFLNLFKVVQELPNNGVSKKQYVKAQVGSEIYFAHKSSSLSKEVVENFNSSSLLETVSEERLQLVLAHIQREGEEVQGQEPLPPLQGREKQAKKLGEATIQKYLNGGFQPSSYYSMMLDSLVQ